jgi:transporter family protein
LGGVVLQFVAAILGIILLVVISIKDNGTHDLPWDWLGIQWSVCAGISVGIAEMLSFFVSGLGVPAVQTIPIIIGGSVMFGTILGLVLLAETMAWQGWVGVLMLIAGICLVGIDHH